MKKLLKGRFDPIPFNEDMSKGNYQSKPFSDGFIKERSTVHGVTTDDYVSNLKEFLTFLLKVEDKDIIHLYFGDDPVCSANSKLLIKYFQERGNAIFFHLMDEYKGIELSVSEIK